MENYKQIYDFYIEDSEKSLIKDILPGYYVDQDLGKNKISADFAVKFLQNELNYILNSFVNGGFSYKGFALYPFIKGVSKENLNSIRRLKKIAIFLNNNGYNFSNSIKKYKENINSKDFAIILSTLYGDFSQIKNKNVESIKKYKCREFDIDSYRKDDLVYLRPLSKLKYYANYELKPYLLGFYLHGSLATQDYIKRWSDVDTLAVVSKNTIENPKKLLELRDKIYFMRYFFYRMDPLQHHGSIIISEYDLESYCQAYFPIPIFRYSKSFFKDDRINNFKIRGYSSEAIHKLFWLVNYFRKLSIEKRFDLGSYDTKTLLHSVTLFPTIYLQAKGTLVYKKFSFHIAKKDFKKNSWEVINGVSFVRSNWKGLNVIPLINLYSKTNPLFYFQLNSIIIDLFKDIKKINNIDIRDIAKSMSKLSEEAWSKIKEDVRSKKL